MNDMRLGIHTSISRWRSTGALCALLALAACGGGGGSGYREARRHRHPTPAPTPAPPSVAAADAARLLEQATFGVTASDVAHVQNIGIDAYIN